MLNEHKDIQKYLRSKYEALERVILPYYTQYSTSLSPLRLGIITEYERCCGYAKDPNFRKNLNKSLLTLSVLTFLGGNLLIPLIIPEIALSLSKIYLLSSGLDYASIYLSNKAKVLRKTDQKTSDSYELYADFFKSISDSILISGVATTLAAPMVGVLSHVQFKLAYNILLPTASALTKAIGFELNKSKAVAFNPEAQDSSKSTEEYLVKAVLIGLTYKVMTTILGGGIVSGLVSFVSAKSIAQALVETKGDYKEIPKHLTKNMAESVGFVAQYCLLGVSDQLVGMLCSSTTGLSAIFMRSVSMKFSDKPIEYIKDFYKGSHDNIKAHVVDIAEKSAKIISEAYSYVYKATEHITNRIDNSLGRH